MKDSFVVLMLPHACEMNLEGLDSDNQHKICNLKNSMFTTYYVVPQDINTTFTTQHPGDCVTVWLRDSHTFFNGPSCIFLDPLLQLVIPYPFDIGLHSTTPLSLHRWLGCAPTVKQQTQKEESNAPRTPKTKEIPQLTQHFEAAAATIVTIVV